MKKTISTFTLKGKRFFVTYTPLIKVLVYDSNFGFYGSYQSIDSFKDYYKKEGDALFLDYRTSIH